jgi:hypothetical protein
MYTGKWSKGCWRKPVAEKRVLDVSFEQRVDVQTGLLMVAQDLGLFRRFGRAITLDEVLKSALPKV